MPRYNRTIRRRKRIKINWRKNTLRCTNMPLRSKRRKSQSWNSKLIVGNNAILNPTLQCRSSIIKSINSLINFNWATNDTSRLMMVCVVQRTISKINRRESTNSKMNSIYYQFRSLINSNCIIISINLIPKLHYLTIK